MTTPLPPPWAARVWVEGGQLHVDCPQGEGHPSHRITYPCDAYGMNRLRVMLSYRGAHSVLGTNGDPTQWKVNKEIATLKRKIDPDKPVKVAKPKDRFTQQARAGARAVLRTIGLIGAVQR